MTDWQKQLQRKQAVANAFYTVIFALVGALVILAAGWLLGKIGGRW